MGLFHVYLRLFVMMYAVVCSCVVLGLYKGCDHIRFMDEGMMIELCLIGSRCRLCSPLHAICLRLIVVMRIRGLIFVDDRRTSMKGGNGLIILIVPYIDCMLYVGCLLGYGPRVFKYD